MSSTSKVSICCISYNHARFLPAALDSALNQTYPNIEIIVVDDGSKDESLSIANQYAQRHPEKIRVYTHPDHANRGISLTANLAFEKSTGDFWQGLPSDDVLYPEKIERQVRYLQRHRNIGWVYSYADYIDAAGNLLPGRFGHDITGSPNPLQRLLIGNSIPGMSVLARRDCIKQIGGHRDDLLYSDWGFWVRLAAHARVGFMPE